MEIGNIGTFILALVGVFNCWQSILAKREARAAHQLTKTTNLSIVTVKNDMQELAVNTNNKMDQTLEAVRAEGVAHATAAGLEGERAGREAGVAQEAARQNKERS